MIDNLEVNKILVLSQGKTLYNQLNQQIDWDKINTSLKSIESVDELICNYKILKPDIILIDDIIDGEFLKIISESIYASNVNAKIIIIDRYEHTINREMISDKTDSIYFVEHSSVSLLKCLWEIYFHKGNAERCELLEKEIYKNIFSAFYLNKCYTVDLLENNIKEDTLFVLGFKAIGKEEVKPLYIYLKNELKIKDIYFNIGTNIVFYIKVDKIEENKIINELLKYGEQHLISYEFCIIKCMDNKIDLFHLDKTINYYINRFFYQKTRIMMYKYNSEIIFDYNKYFKYETFTELIMDNQYIKALDKLIVDIDSIKFNSFITEEYFKKILTNCLHVLFLQLDSIVKQNHELMKLKYNFSIKILRCKTKEECLDFVKSMTKMVRPIINCESSDLIQDILNYTRLHYKENITLKDLSKRYHFSYSYLSSFLAENSPFGFNDYLNKVRISEAKKLLLSTHLSIGEISKTVGYNDSGYFSKVFKREEGLTPSKFRKKVHH